MTLHSVVHGPKASCGQPMLLEPDVGKGALQAECFGRQPFLSGP